MFMLIHHKWISLYLLVFSFASFTLFLYGFFPIKYHAGKVTSWNDLPMSINGTIVDGQELYNQGDKRVVLMVIDALRYDFVTEEYMPFTAQLLKNGSACIHIAMAEPPTVTMPRIKAMMTGSVSTFADVALNFGAPAVRGDSVVRAAAARGRTTVMYGDDTWLRLFPGLWSRAEGTTSFYVSDYTEVDNNVTRNLDSELTPDAKTGLPPFEFMVLHYLGLDHIGHLEGPRSPKIKPKLFEMDNIVKKIHKAMQSWKVGGAIFLCGDHGMRDSGGHGGASPAELLVPLVIAHATDFTCPHHWLSPPIVAQVDVAPSLSALLRVQLPGDNTGRVLHSVLPTDLERRLYVLHYNARNNAEALLHTLGAAEAREKECYKQYERAVRQHKKWLSGAPASTARAAAQDYDEALDQMAKFLAESTVDFDIFAIVLAIFLLFMSLTSLLLVTLHSFQSREHFVPSRRVVGMGTGLAVLVVCVCCAGLLVLSCAISETESLLCKPKPQWLFAMFLVLLIIVFNFFVIKVSSERASHLSLVKDANWIDYFLVIGTFVHSLTFAATSFIEEEHQTWYFYWNTLMMLVFVRTLGMLVHYLKLRWEGATEIQDKPQLKADMSLLGADLLPKWLLLICLHRFLRTLNQTGDRWAFLPDTADWLNELQNKHILEILMFVGTTTTVLICLQNLRTTRNPFRINSFLTILAYACILYYRHSTDNLTLPLLTLPKSDSVIEVQIFWYILIAQLIIETWSFKRKIVKIHSKKDDDIYRCEGTDISYLGNGNNAFVTQDTTQNNKCEDLAKLDLVVSLSHIVLNNMMLTFALLMRPHNVILVPSVYLTSRLTSRCLTRDGGKQVNVLTETLVHFWIGSLFFFYQGNSNSLASVDLGAGYVGLSAYSPIPVALRMGAHAYAAPALAGMALFTQLAKHAINWMTYVKSMRQCMSVLALTRVYELCVYACVAAGFRHHLFVWTVFSPKLLYDFTSTAFSIAALFTIFTIYTVTMAVNPSTDVTNCRTSTKTKL